MEPITSEDVLTAVDKHKCMEGIQDLIRDALAEQGLDLACVVLLAPRGSTGDGIIGANATPEDVHEMMQYALVHMAQAIEEGTIQPEPDRKLDS